MRSFNLKAVSDWSNEIMSPNSVWIKLYDMNGWLYSSDKWTKWGGVLAWNMLELLNWTRIVCLFDFDTPLTSVAISGWGVFKHRLRFYYATWRRPTWMKKIQTIDLSWNEKKTNLSFGQFFCFSSAKKVESLTYPALESSSASLGALSIFMASVWAIGAQVTRVTT